MRPPLRHESFSAHDCLAVDVSHAEIGGRLVLSRSHAVGTGTVSSIGVPNVVVVAIVSSVCRDWVPRAVMVCGAGSGLLVRSLSRIGSRRKAPREPVVVLGVVAGCGIDRGRVEILGCAITRIGRCERHVAWGLIGGPATHASSVPSVLDRRAALRRQLAPLQVQALKTLILGNLLLMPRGIAGSGARVNVRVDPETGRHQAFPRSLSLLPLLGGLPLLPALEPGAVVLAPIQIDVEIPVDCSQPLVLKRVQLLHTDAADLGPRAVLERVVVEELASEEKGGRQHAPDLSLGDGRTLTTKAHHVDSLGHVVHSQKNGRARQPSRRENL